MSRTIEAIMRHMVHPAAGPDSTNVSVRSTNTVVVRRKPERKLRVVFAPPPLSASTTPNNYRFTRPKNRLSTKIP